MRKRWKEVDIASAVVQWLEKKGWTVYQEVQVYERGDIADIVATRDDKVWIVETKSTLGITLMAQAASWARYAHRVDVAVPEPKRRRKTKSRRFAEQILDGLGVGVLQVEKSFDKLRVVEIHRALREEPSATLLSKLKASLQEEHKTFAKAGNPDGRRWSKWQQTCARMREYVTKHPGTDLKKVLASIDHHYANPRSAFTSMKKWLTERKVEGVYAGDVGSSIKLYPTPRLPRIDL